MNLINVFKIQLNLAPEMTRLVSVKFINPIIVLEESKRAIRRREPIKNSQIWMIFTFKPAFHINIFKAALVLESR